MLTFDDDGDVSCLHPIARARAVSALAHAGQVDKAGAPYVLHPERVADLLVVLDLFAGLSPADRELAVVAAYLHDVVEDTGLTLDDIGGLFPDVAGVVEVVEALTHRRSEPRKDYYARVAASRVARVVKYADLLDNTDPERMAVLDSETAGRLASKYAAAFAALALPQPRHLRELIPV